MDFQRLQADVVHQSQCACLCVLAAKRRREKTVAVHQALDMTQFCDDMTKTRCQPARARHAALASKLLVE